MGMWLSGRAFALHVKGPGFDPRHLHILLLFLCFVDVDVLLLLLLLLLLLKVCGMETYISKDGDLEYKLGCVDKSVSFLIC